MIKLKVDKYLCFCAFATASSFSAAIRSMAAASTAGAAVAAEVAASEAAPAAVAEASAGLPPPALPSAFCRRLTSRSSLLTFSCDRRGSRAPRELSGASTIVVLVLPPADAVDADEGKAADDAARKDEYEAASMASEMPAEDADDDDEAADDADEPVGDTETPKLNGSGASAEESEDATTLVASDDADDDADDDSMTAAAAAVAATKICCSKAGSSLPVDETA